jgi:hypothetical protein
MGFCFFAPYTLRFTPYGKKGGLWLEGTNPRTIGYCPNLNKGKLSTLQPLRIISLSDLRLLFNFLGAPVRFLPRPFFPGAFFFFATFIAE